MWEEKVHIYDTSGVYNNFLLSCHQLKGSSYLCLFSKFSLLRVMTPFFWVDINGCLYGMQLTYEVAYIPLAFEQYSTVWSNQSN